MATQEVTGSVVVSEKTSSAFQGLFNNHPNQDVTPYLDTREMAGLLLKGGLESMAHVVEGSFTTDADGAADGVDVAVGFSPKAVIIHNQTDGLMYLKLKSHAGLFSLKFTLAGPVIAFANTTVKMGNVADDSVDGFAINAAEIAAAGKVISYLAIG